MSEQYGSMMKICATCQYWGGSREVKQWGAYLEINSSTDTGLCYSSNSSFGYGPPMQACNGCPCWEKWAPLK